MKIGLIDTHSRIDFTQGLDIRLLNDDDIEKAIADHQTEKGGEK